MKIGPIEIDLAAVARLAAEFRRAPFRAAKALIILGIVLVCVITQLAGHAQSTAYGWMLGGLFLLIVVLFVTLRLAYRFDREQES